MSATAARAYVRTGTAITLVGLVALAGVYVLALKFTPDGAAPGAGAEDLLSPRARGLERAAGLLAGGALRRALSCGSTTAGSIGLAASSAEVGVALGVVMLTTGPIWAKPIWGTWWTWDARLTLTLFLFFLFVGYLALRAALHDPGERARFSAVVGVLGLLLVPFIHLSVYLFRTLHPQPIVLKPSAPSLPPEMLRTLLVSALVFLVLFIGLVTIRYGLALAEEETEGRLDAA